MAPSTTSTSISTFLIIIIVKILFIIIIISIIFNIIILFSIISRRIINKEAEFSSD